MRKLVRTGWVAALGAVGAVLSAGCPAPAPVTPTRMVVELQGQNLASAGGLTLSVPHLVAQQRAGGGWHVTATVVGDFSGRMNFDGLQTSFESSLVPHDRFKLFIDGREWDPVPDPTLPDGLGENLYVPAVPPRRGQGAVAWDVDTPMLGDDVFVRARAYQGVADVRMRGTWRGADHKPAVAVQLLEASGRVVDTPVTLVSGDEVIARDGAWHPWLVPARPGTWTVTGEGLLATQVTIPDPPPADLAVTVTRSDPGARFDSELVATWGAPSADRRDDVLKVSDAAPPGLDGAVAWLDDHIAVLPTMSFQHSVGYAVRRGAGAPFERALLGQEFARRLGLEARVACGDLEPDQAALLYTSAVPVAADPLLASLTGNGAAGVAGLQTGLEAALGAWPERPYGHRSRYDVVPEWCWLESRPKTEADDGTWTSTDLRPQSLRDTPLPYVWRTMTSLGSEVWWINVMWGATFRHVIGGEESWETVELVNHSTNAAVLSETGLLLDLFQSEDPETLRSQFVLLSDGEATGEAGKDIPTKDLVALYLQLTWNDPDHMDDAIRTYDVWIPRPGEKLQALRVLLSGDSGMVSGERVRERLSRAISGAHPTPDALAMWARHDLYAAVRAQLDGGRVPAEPQILATTLRAFEDGRASWTFDAYPSTTPAAPGAATVPADVAMFAAADAVARSLLLGVEPPAPPVDWIRSEADQGKLAVADGEEHSSVVRGLRQMAYGVAEGGTLWTVDRTAGGVTWLDRLGAPATPAPRAPAGAIPGSRTWPFSFWDRTIRCTEAKRWAALLGTKSPSLCDD